jgi:hypothetical protein
MFKNDDEIRQEIINDPRGVGAILDDIFLNKESMDHKAYFTADHPMHENAVKKVAYLMTCEHGDRVYNKEVFPKIISTAPEKEADDVDYDYGDGDRVYKNEGATAIINTKDW